MTTSTPANVGAFLVGKGVKPFEVGPAPMPSPGSHEVLIRVGACAANNADVVVQNSGLLHKVFPVVIGCDLAGEVYQVGSEVQKFKVGDRVVAAVFKGAFQKFCVAPDFHVARIPDTVTFAQACVLGLPLLTSTVGLFEEDMLALPMPQDVAATQKSHGKVLLVWGGSSVIGSCAIQMARASGYRVAALASPRNFEYCRDLGADWVFDYKSGQVAKDITSALAGQTFGGAYCAVNDPDAVNTCCEIADRLGGHKFVSTVYPPFVPVPGLKLPEGVKIGYCWKAGFTESTATFKIFTWLEGALAEGKFRCKPDPIIVGAGLDKCQEAVDSVAKGVSAGKMVAIIE